MANLRFGQTRGTGARFTFSKRDGRILLVERSERLEARYVDADAWATLSPAESVPAPFGYEGLTSVVANDVVPRPYGPRVSRTRTPSSERSETPCPTATLVDDWYAYHEQLGECTAARTPAAVPRTTSIGGSIARRAPSLPTRIRS